MELVQVVIFGASVSKFYVFLLEVWYEQGRRSCLTTPWDYDRKHKTKKEKNSLWRGIEPWLPQVSI